VQFDVTEDLNALFGNPCPGVKKEIRIKYICIGNDADQTTTSEELTTRGFQRNIIAHLHGETKAEVRTPVARNQQIVWQTHLIRLAGDPYRSTMTCRDKVCW
jgi:hypothetical protein